LQRWWKGLKTRGSTEIIGLILQAVERQALTRSKIMYHAILNFKQVTDYTAFLTKEGLLTYLSQDRKYTITDRGRQFLTLFKETNKLLTTHYDDMAANNEEQNQQEPPPPPQQQQQ
jgi:predicted transcriptional regulator